MQVSNSENRTTEVAALAYQLWEQDGRPVGKDLEHWLQAEQLIREGKQIKGSSPSRSPEGRSAPTRSAPPRQASAETSRPVRSRK